MRIITKPKSKDEEYEKLKKKIERKNLIAKEYEKAIKKLCEKIKY